MSEFKLNDQQISMLEDIQSKRYKLLKGVLIALPAALIGDFVSFINKTVPGKINIPLTIFLILTAGLVSVLFYLYYKKVLPVKKDILEKSGNYDRKVIVQKTVFEHIGKYYFFFGDEKLPSKEVTREEYIGFNVGDVYQIPMSKHSNIVVDGFMNYDLL